MPKLTELSTQLITKCQTLEGSVSLFVKFLSTGETITYNETTQFWAASVIKLPIVSELYRQVSQGKHDLARKLKVEGENRVLGSGVIKLLDSSDEYTILDLIKLTIDVSDNAATNVLVDLIGWESVEKYMTELGLTQTTFKHKMMIKAGRGPNLTTTADITKLLELLYLGKVPGSAEILSIMQEQHDRSRIPLLLPNDVKISHKTGSLPEAVHDAGIIFSKNPFSFVFLSDDQKDKLKTTMVCAECARICFDYCN